MSFLHIFLLVSVQVFCVWAWISRKCLLLYEDVSYKDYDIHFFGICPRSNATVACKDVTDIKLEVSAIMVDTEILCLWINNGTSLQPATFTSVHSLRSLYIHGCLSAILPEAFRGLTNLHLLSMSCHEFCNTSVPSKVFHDLYNLEELKLKNYAVSKMADVFDGLSHIKKFNYQGNDNFSEVLCKVSYLSASLEYLSIEMDVETLMTPNCMYGPGQFPSLREASFSFPHVKKIERNIFKHIEKVSSLRMEMNEELHAQLLHSGLQQVDRAQFRLTNVNIKSICEIVLVLNITDITLQFNAFQEYFSTSWEKCYKLENITLNIQSLTTLNFSLMSTLNNVMSLSIDLNGKCTFLEDKSLMTLCTGQASSIQPKLLIYRTQQYLILRNKQLACLRQLEQLILTGKFTRIEKSAFEGLGNLQYLKLTALSFATDVRYNKSENTIVHDSNLRNITIENYAFEGLSGLCVLQLAAQILTIKANFFSGLDNLLELALNSDNIQTIEDFAFANLEQLKNLYLIENRISKIQTNTFKGLKNLETLVLDSNPIMYLAPSSFSHFPSLKVLHLKDLRLFSPEHTGIQVFNLSLIFGRFPHQLSDLAITAAVRPMTLAISDDSAPEVGLSLTLSGQKIVLWGCERPFIKSVTKLHVLTDFFLCAPDHTVAVPHFTSVTNLHFILLYTATMYDLSGLSRLVHLKRLILRNVNFYNQPGISVMFHGLTKLESLGLFNCLMSSFDRVISVDMRSLKYLCLHISSETTLSKDFFEPLHSLKYVVLFGPRLFCNCENSWFSSWAKLERQTGMFLASKQHRTLQCLNVDKVQDLDRYGLTHCSPEEGLELFLITTGILVLFILTVLMYHLRKNTRGHYFSYDVFVSHSGKDDSWVVDRLLPWLKQRGPPFLRLCLPRKDFQPGKDTVENITDSLNRSHRILCLISCHYLESNWCSLEMRLGTYRLQVEHGDVLILVFLEKVPTNLLSAHHRLARLIKTTTYIEWPQDPTQQEAFWETVWEKLVPEAS